MNTDYLEQLHANPLYQKYETSLKRLKQYFDAEVNFVRRGLCGHEKILELGAGYGRIVKELAPYASSITGIDISTDSVGLGKKFLHDCPGCELHVMDAHKMNYDSIFDIVICLQNGLSALQGEAHNIIQRSLKALKYGGKAYFSTFSPHFLEHKLEWFKEQAQKGLVGTVDPLKSSDNLITCKNGVTSKTFSPNEMRELGKNSGCNYWIQEVDGSSLFLVLEK